MERRGLGFSLIALVAVIGAILLPRLSAPVDTEKPGAAQPRKEDTPTSPPASAEADVAELLADHFQVDLRPAKGRNRAQSGENALKSILEVAKGVSIKSLIAIVPDPVDSVETWQFDPDLEALRMAIGSAGYQLDRFRLPGVDTGGSRRDTSDVQRHQRDPGVVLFTRQSAPGAPEEMLVLFLVPETPTAGIHHQAFVGAMRFVAEWSRMVGPARAPLMGIVGPAFSGSAPSLRRAFGSLHRLALDPPCEPIRVISGSASNSSNRAIIEQDIPCGSGGRAGQTHISFSAAVHPNELVEAAIARFMQETGLSNGTGERTAVLYEGSTSFGNDIGQVGRPAATAAPASGAGGGTGQNQDQRLRIEVPFNISELRSAGSQARQRIPSLDTVLPNVRPLPLQDSTAKTDQLTVRVPEMMSAYVELVLRNLIDTLRRAKVRAVHISTTDVRDRLYLTRELNQRAPDIAVILSDGDLLISHPDQFRWTRQVFVASSYPLHTSTQGASQKPRQFYNLPTQGIYNATLLILRPLLPTDARLVDYDAVTPSTDGCPSLGPTNEDTEGRTTAATRAMPRIWISAVSRYSAWPVRAFPACDTFPADRADAIFGYMADAPTNYAELGSAETTGRDQSGPAPSAATRVALTLVGIGGVGLGALVWGLRGRRPPYAWALLAAASLVIAVIDIKVDTYGSPWPVTVLVLSPLLFVLPLLFFGRPPAKTLGFVLVASAAVAVPVAWAFEDLWRHPLTRALSLEVESGVSPLISLLMASSLPLLLTLVTLRVQHLRDDGATGLDWRTCAIETVTTLLGGPARLDWSALAHIHERLYAPAPIAWIPAVGVVVAAAAAILFWDGLPFSPLGTPFTWAVALSFLVAQAVLCVALIQFAVHWRRSVDLLRRLARHPVASSFKDVPRALMPTSLLPRRPRLYELQAIIDALDECGAWKEKWNDTFADDLAGSKRWWATTTWHHVLAGTKLGAERTKAEPSSRMNRQRRLALAIVCVVMIREVLAHLSVCLLLILPALAIQIGLYSTVLIQSRHGVLALIWANAAASVWIIMSAFIQMDRDETLSLIANTTPGQLDWNFDLMSKVGVYAVLPLLTLFLSQFPGIAASVVDVFRSVPTLP